MSKSMNLAGLVFPKTKLQLNNFWFLFLNGSIFVFGYF